MEIHLINNALKFVVILLFNLQKNVMMEIFIRLMDVIIVNTLVLKVVLIVLKEYVMIVISKWIIRLIILVNMQNVNIVMNVY